ncbi:MAG: helix-turn-helix transcriptional regulator [Gemmatimonadota bacterium]
MIPSPMKPQWFQILLALARQPLHGYGIQRAVLERTADQMRLWPAMLYRSLATLEEEGLLEQVAAPDGEPDDERRQYYALTREGRERLRRESELLARWARAAEAELS